MNTYIVVVKDLQTRELVEDLVTTVQEEAQTWLKQWKQEYTVEEGYSVISDTLEAPVGACIWLVDWRKDNGWRWKRKLAKLWASGKDTGEARQLRNTLGPRGLQSIKL